jgi:hypothetical protein
MVARVAQTCTSSTCADLLVRGTKISVLSIERVQQIERRHGGTLPRDPQAGTLVTKLCPADIRFPAGFVLVHDTESSIYPRCDVFVVRWRARRGSPEKFMDQDALKTARDYFGDRARIQRGSVEVPAGPWSYVCNVKFIRYTRHPRTAREVPLFAPGHEHEYSPAVRLYSCTRPLAWKLSLAGGCIVDDRGFVVP